MNELACICTHIHAQLHIYHNYQFKSTLRFMITITVCSENYKLLHECSLTVYQPRKASMCPTAHSPGPPSEWKGWVDLWKRNGNLFCYHGYLLLFVSECYHSLRMS